MKDLILKLACRLVAEERLAYDAQKRACVNIMDGYSVVLPESKTAIGLPSCGSGLVEGVYVELANYLREGKRLLLRRSRYLLADLWESNVGTILWLSVCEWSGDRKRAVCLARKVGAQEVYDHSRGHYRSTSELVEESRSLDKRPKVG